MSRAGAAVRIRAAPLRPVRPQGAHRHDHCPKARDASTGSLPIVADAESPVDQGVLASLTGANPDVEMAVLANFRRVNDDDAATLAHAVDEQAIGNVTRAAHRIKGACRMIGARSLAAVSEAIEHASRADDWAEVRSNIAAFDAERIRLNRWIDGLLLQRRDHEQEQQKER